MSARERAKVLVEKIVAEYVALETRAENAEHALAESKEREQALRRKFAEVADSGANKALRARVVELEAELVEARRQLAAVHAGVENVWLFLDTDKKYGGRPWSAVRLYMANAGAPLLSYGADPKIVIYPKGSNSYDMNKPLDTNSDGQITIGDLITAVDYHKKTPEYVAAVYRYRKVNDLYPFRNPSLPG